MAEGGQRVDQWYKDRDEIRWGFLGMAGMASDDLGFGNSEYCIIEIM